jgi:hypothetical protein
LHYKLDPSHFAGTRKGVNTSDTLQSDVEREIPKAIDNE